jgi:hypothetical protein
MTFKKVNYKDLNGRQKEVYNFHKIAAVLADYGFNCLKLTDDWQGADFLAYQMLGSTETLKVQLKSRISIDRKYEGKNIWIAFPRSDVWYLIEHDTLRNIIGQTTPWLSSPSWKEHGFFNSHKPSAKLLKELEEYKIGY